MSLEFGVSHPGIYGNTAGYYGTVEQQGRLNTSSTYAVVDKECTQPSRSSQQDIRPQF